MSKDTVRPPIIKLQTVVDTFNSIKSDDGVKVKPSRMAVKKALIKAGGDQEKAREILISDMKAEPPPGQMIAQDEPDPSDQFGADDETDSKAGSRSKKNR